MHVIFCFTNLSGDRGDSAHDFAVITRRVILSLVEFCSIYRSVLFFVEFCSIYLYYSLSSF